MPSPLQQLFHPDTLSMSYVPDSRRVEEEDMHNNKAIQKTTEKPSDKRTQALLHPDTMSPMKAPGSASICPLDCLLPGARDNRLYTTQPPALAAAAKQLELLAGSPPGNTEIPMTICKIPKRIIVPTNSFSLRSSLQSKPDPTNLRLEKELWPPHDRG
jgi:hypothetical protein